ncbi:dTMP kinase [Variovorax paradoxus]|uniref:dTMP kinase n=1 Tax=Variovorax paradoxus TaxID=34073 RepID=UPI0030D0492E
MPFISFEGIDGSGKSEQVRRIVEHLRDSGRSVLQTKEPDGGHLGAEVRAILTRPQRTLDATEQLLLVSAARYDHVKNVIRPALAAGAWVVSDRFLDSTSAFQVSVSETNLRPLFQAACDIVVGTTLPDLTLILDLPPQVAISRRRLRGDQEDDPAEKTRDFSAIRSALLEIARNDRRRCRVVNADQPVDQVAAAVRRIIEQSL